MITQTDSLPRSARLVAALILGLLAVACGGSDDEGSSTGGSAGTAGSGGNGGGSGGSGGNTPASWETLIDGAWTLDAGTEEYQCVRKTIDEDILLGGFDPIDPEGTHHLVLSVGEISGADGMAPCGPGTNNGTSLFGAGVGTNQLEFPEGIAVRIPAGQQLLLNLHLFNVAGSELSGTSGMSVRRVAAEDVVHEGQALLMGPVGIFIPANSEKTTEGSCTQEDDVTVFAIQPHMHQIGTHMKVVAKSSLEGDVVIHDEPFDFDRQEVHLVDPVRLAGGDRISVECTWQNPTSELVTFGDSSTQEMCFGVVYRYPVVGDHSLVCFE